MEKVLVSGVSGFIGMHCAKQLLDKGYQVVGTTRSSSKHDEVMGAIGHENLSLVNVFKIERYRAQVSSGTYIRSLCERMGGIAYDINRIEVQ